MRDYRKAVHKVLALYGSDRPTLVTALDMLVRVAVEQRLEAERQAPGVMPEAQEGTPAPVSTPGDAQPVKVETDSSQPSPVDAPRTPQDDPGDAISPCPGAHATEANGAATGAQRGKGRGGGQPSPSDALAALPGALVPLPEASPILRALAAGPLSGRELARTLGGRWATVFKALRGLEAGGMVRREGTGARARFALVAPATETASNSGPAGDEHAACAEPSPPTENNSERTSPSGSEEKGPPVDFNEVGAGPSVRILQQAALDASGDLDLLAEAVLAEEVA